MASPEDHKEWLELGLGLSINNACSRSRRKLQDEENPNNIIPTSAAAAAASSKLQLAKQQKLPGGGGGGGGCSSTSSGGLELGLSLGGIEDMVQAPSGNIYDHHQISLLWQNQQHSDDDDDDDDMAWWPCDMNINPPVVRSYVDRGGLVDVIDDDDWQMPVPNNSHHYNYSYLSLLPPTTRVPHSVASGLWFTLHSYTNSNGEAALPQIPKAYIRVKDENVTIFMVKKYLVRKLGLSNEAEVEISCMGQKLMHTQTLKQVRDCVWLPTLLESVSFQNYSHQSNCVNNHHLMSLYYGRRCANLN